MQIRPATVADLKQLPEIDGTIESGEYLHLERGGDGLAQLWRLELRPLREKLIESNALRDETAFIVKQIVTGADEGIALVAEHNDTAVALAVAQPQPSMGTMKLFDLRVDYDVRREGIATVMLYQLMQAARDQELRALAVETRTDNVPASMLLGRLPFQLTGVDTHRHSNHDMVKESATLFWYAPLD